MKRRLRILELAVQRADALAAQGIVYDLTHTLDIWNGFVEDGVIPLSKLSET